MSQALIDLDITHEEFKTIVNEKEKYDQMKENIKNTKSKYELRENNKENSENSEIFWFSVYKIVITKELLKITKETWENMV